LQHYGLIWKVRLTGGNSLLTNYQVQLTYTMEEPINVIKYDEIDTDTKALFLMMRKYLKRFCLNEKNRNCLVLAKAIADEIAPRLGENLILLDTDDDRRPPVLVDDSKRPFQDDRTTPVRSNVVPNLHLGKSVLTVEELRELLAWGVENLSQGNVPDVMQHVIRGEPDSAVNKLVDFLGTIAYGVNNFIGPGKTGMTVDSLLNIAQQVPVLSERDAEARAHDFLLEQAYTIGGQEAIDKADSVLTGPMYWAQVVQPYFVEKPEFYSGIGSTNYDLLMLAGDVERNPGPRYDYNKVKSIDKVIDLIDNPVSSSAKYSNSIANDQYIDESRFVAGYGAWEVKGARSDQVDVAQLSSNWVEIGGCNIYNGTMRGRNAGQGLRISMQNQVVRTKLAKTDKSTGLDDSMVAYRDLMSNMRTVNNMVSGSADLNLYIRMTNADFGDYDSMAKLLAYESMKQLLTGCQGDSVIIDTMTRKPADVLPAVSSYFPCTANTVAPPLILAWNFNIIDMAAMLRGDIPWPAQDPRDQSSVAVVLVQSGLSGAMLDIATVCELEFPFQQLDYVQDYMITSAGGAAPIDVGGVFTCRPFSDNVLIDGPKNIVYFIHTTATASAITVGGVAVPYLAGGVGTDIGVGLGASFLLYMRQPQGNGLFNSMMSYFLSFMSIEDWRAANVLAAFMTRWKRSYNTLGHRADADPNNSVRIMYGGNAPPTIDVSAPLLFTQTMSNANADLWTNGQNQIPCFSLFGTPSITFPAIIAGVARASIPFSYTIQKNSFLTKMGVICRFYGKATLTNRAFQDITSVVSRAWWFMIKEMSEIFIQCSHNWIQERGLVHFDMFPTAGAGIIQNNSVNHMHVLDSLLSAVQYRISGFYFLRMAVPWPHTTAAIVNTINIWRDQWLDSPIYLYNHLNNVKDKAEDLYYTGMDKALVTRNFIGAWVKSNSQKPCPQPAAVWGGFNVDRTAQIIISDAFDGPNGNQLMKKNVKDFFALSQMTHGFNVGFWNSATDFFFFREFDATYVKQPSPYCVTCEFLRYDSVTAPAYEIRKSRPTILLVMPCYPRPQDSATGRLLYPAVATSTILNMLKDSFCLDGVGSAVFPLTTATQNVFGSLMNTFSFDDAGAIPPSAPVINSAGRDLAGPGLQPS